MKATWYGWMRMVVVKEWLSSTSRDRNNFSVQVYSLFIQGRPFLKKWKVLFHVLEIHAYLTVPCFLTKHIWLGGGRRLEIRIMVQQQETGEGAEVNLFPHVDALFQIPLPHAICLGEHQSLWYFHHALLLFLLRAKSPEIRPGWELWVSGNHL